ncbi:alpha/beta fold hydrolase [Rhodococcus globerulus]|uniref:Alpha/beta hydrolase n=1 Tax=Rhodococcus globerulus TaxID=33008 RepID=A0ABU4BWT8_RHOGO|nr:alpha/beta hydrolase [Rhodococcus globerulus]MDV6268696.1 alpha/beta hydrolase [Rhodococcus globerulus]
MDTVRSADGTMIAYERSGAGPAVVLVAGAFCDRQWFNSLAAELAADFTVYSYDRRGRGDSGDGSAYSIGAEVEDLRAVIAATGEVPLVYGLSSGAALALEAAAQGVPMRKLAVYEAPYMDEGQSDAAALGDLWRLVAAGDKEGAVVRFLSLTGASSHMVEEMKQSSDWPGMCAIAHTLPYDVAICNHGSQSLDWLTSAAVPALVMHGGDSGQWGRSSAARISERIGGAKALEIPGQAHGVSDDAIVPVLREFFS